MNKLITLVTASLLLGAMASAEPATQAVKSPANKKVVAPSKTPTNLVVNRIEVQSVNRSDRRQFLAHRPFAVQAETLLRKGGLTNDKAIIAVLSNAWYESKWWPAAGGGYNIGFFQLNHRGGMGRGHRVSQLKKLEYNVKVMMVSTDFKNWCAWVKKNPGATAGQMAYRFAAKVERCTSKSWGPRASTANKWHASAVKNKGSTG